ncbi:MAG TPA: UvrD-helicase domain-containing protein [Bryobacteraceae bacterium]|nr:UvrD-helicase domain-containing protein [Bryobacteraceae bacterium]
MTLNSAQRAAVERWGQDVCVVAGPGSGKTRVLIERFRWLVEQRNISPRRILAVTFTEKAATEIRKRLIESFSSSEELREEIERAWVSTIHGFCTRLLKENAIAAGIDPDFTLLDEAQSRILQRQSAQRVLDSLLTIRPEPMRVLLRELNAGADSLADALLDLYEETRTAGIPVTELVIPPLPSDNGWSAVAGSAKAALSDPPNGTYNQRQHHQRFHQWANAVLAIRNDSPWRELVTLLDQMPSAKSLKSGSRARAIALELEETLVPRTKAVVILKARHDLYPLVLDALAKIHADYAEAKRAEGLLDFEDLHEFAIRLLQSNHPLRDRVRNSFDQILMDELQDTNRLQWRLIGLVRRADTLFAVGDINQSIYYFRHADPEVFRQFRDSLADRGLPVDELRQNYRSRPEIIQAVNRVVAFLPGGVEPHRLEARREASPASGSLVEYLHTFNATPDDDAVRTEARWIANRIRQLGDEIPYSGMAVLARTIGALAPVQEALDGAGIPSVVSGGRSFYEAREIRDLSAWLAVLANPRDEIALATVLRSPLVGANDELLLRLALQNSEDLFAAVQASADARLQWFHQLIGKQRLASGTTPPDALLAQAMDESNYQDGLPSRARANISKFLAALRARFLLAPSTPGELVDQLALWRETASEPEASTGELTNCVRLMSVHAAKGLEFPVVFLAAMRAGAQNREPVFCFDAGRTLGATWRHPDLREGISDPVHLAMSFAKKRQEAGEEDRLLYVAMTRAEERLIFSASPNGRADWARKVAEGLLLPTAVPKQEHEESIYTAIRVAPGPAGSRGSTPEHDPEVLTLDPPETPDQYDFVVPVTSVAQHAFCPRQYYLGRYVGLIPPAPAPDGDPGEGDTGEWTASEFGVAVHELLAGKSPAEIPAQAQQLAQGFFESPLGQRAARATKAGREYDFLVEVEEMILRGQIDLWFEEANELVLIDYKSDQVNAGEEKRHTFRYGPQIRLYALALEKLTGRLPDKAIVWYLRTRTAVEVSLHPKALEEARVQVVNLRNAQSTVTFPLREGPHCLRCPHYHNACPSAYLIAPAHPNRTV